MPAQGPLTPLAFAGTFGQLGGVRDLMAILQDFYDPPAFFDKAIGLASRL